MPKKLRSMQCTRPKDATGPNEDVEIINHLMENNLMRLRRRTESGLDLDY
jgi:hypothetical protein